MKKIERLVKCIDGELKDAKNYAESYLEAKSEGYTDRASRYKEMANDELKHADYNHNIAVEDIRQLRTVYTPPAEMEQEWDTSHKTYIEKTAWIKTMLAM